MGAADIASLTQACPGLQELSLQSVVSDPAAASALFERLEAVTNLTNLTFSGTVFGDAAAAEVVKLTGLKSLAWKEHAVKLDPPQAWSTQQRRSGLTAAGKLAMLVMRTAHD